MTFTRNGVFSTPDKKREKILVWAGNLNEFEIFCESIQKGNEKEGKLAGMDFYYSNSPDQLRGMRFDNYYTVGTYYLRTDFTWEFVQSLLKPRL